MNLKNFECQNRLGSEGVKICGFMMEDEQTFTEMAFKKNLVKK